MLLPDARPRTQLHLRDIPLSLYVHFPWCIRKCPYCDFNSHTLGRALDEAGYIRALVSDLIFELPQLSGERPLSSIFLGGGTPSLFSAASVGSLLQDIERHIPFAGDIEITMEANPGTTEHADFSAYRSAGINRLSLGVQSFDSACLEKLGRIHSAREAIQAVEQAFAGGIENLNIDLMYGLPGQTVTSALHDINQVLALGPAHVSAYQLTLEPNTVFHRYPPAIPGEEIILEIQQCLQQELYSAGYRQYEISAHARARRQCRHNRNYWEFGDYIGIGPGAHGKLTDNRGVIARRARRKHPASYIGVAGTAAVVSEIRSLQPADTVVEYLMNALRLREGFTLGQAAARTGLPESVFRNALGPATGQGLVETDRGHVRCSPLGYRFLDTILTSLPDITLSWVDGGIPAHKAVS